MTRSILLTTAAIAALLATTALSSTSAFAMNFGERSFEVSPAFMSLDGTPSKGSRAFGKSSFSDLPIEEVQKVRKSGGRMTSFDVTGDPQIVFGQPGAHKKGMAGLGATGFSDAEAGVGDLNVPGSQNVPKKSGKSATLLASNGGGASSLNLPGSQSGKNKGIDKAGQMTAAMSAEAKALLSLANNNGVNNLNIPTDSSSGDMASREVTREQLGQGPAQQGSGPIMYTNPDTADFLSRGSSQSPGKGAKGGEGDAAAAGGKTDSSSDALINTGLTGADHGESKAAQAGSATPKSSESGASKAGSPQSGKKNNSSDNNPDSDTSPVDPNAGISTDSALAHTTDGGGTDNNGTETSSTTNQLATNSSYARKGYGDGTGDNADNGTDTPVLLADDTILAHSGDGDGGSGDGRGDNGRSGIGSWVTPMPAGNGGAVAAK